MGRLEAPRVESKGRLHQEEPTSQIPLEEQVQGDGEEHRECGHSWPCQNTGSGQPDPSHECGILGRLLGCSGPGDAHAPEGTSTSGQGCWPGKVRGLPGRCSSCSSSPVPQQMELK